MSEEKSRTERVRTSVARERIEGRLRSRGLEAEWRGAPPEAFSGISDDSRRIRQGDLFCAVKGLRFDGHEFLAEAERAGATASVVERPVEGSGLPQAVVRDSREALAHLASLFHDDPGRKLAVAGVTGTNGKTTTAWLVRHLVAGGEPTAALGTLGVVDPDGEVRDRELTTPAPVEMMATLEDLHARGASFVAMEVSSHALDQRRADGIPFAAMIFTNFSREHLEYHADMEAYHRAKLRAAELVREGGALVVDADEEAWRDLREVTHADRLYYGLSGAADVRAEDVRILDPGTGFRLVTPGGTADVRFPLPALFNVRNALAAAAAAWWRGASTREIARRLSRAPQVPGRMEILSREPCLVIRDYAHTPDAMERVLKALRPAGERLLLVFGCGGDRDPGKRPAMGRAAARGADLSLVTTDNPRSEDPADIVRDVVQGMPGGSYRIVLDRRDAIARALELADSGDVVLLAGKGHEDYQLFGDRKEPFDEAKIVEELTRNGGIA